MTHVGDAAVDLLQELVAIDSVNPGLVPGAVGETSIIHFLESRLAKAGFTTTIVTPHSRPDRPSLLAVGPGPVEWPAIVLNGHVDTVGVEGMPTPFTPRIDGDRLYGRGAADMKGGVSGIVAAAEAIAADGSPVRPVLALVADEEDASIGSAAVIEALPRCGINPKLCLISEPTDLAISRSLRGFGVVKVTFPGRACHSSQPENGINAITHMSRFLGAVDQRSREIQAKGGDFMVTSVSGGLSTFVVPDSAECIVEMRTTPTQVGAETLDEVQALLDSEWNATAELTLARDGWQLDDSGPAAEFARELASHLGTGPTFDAPYWMEAPMWQGACPTLICGPSGGGLHAIDEWVSLDQVWSFAEGLAATLRSI